MMHRRKKFEFSKMVLALVMCTYFSACLLGAYIVLKSPVELGALLTFIGAPTATAIGFYLWKAKNENMQKYSNTPVTIRTETNVEQEREVEDNRGTQYPI